jgi:hypothetical protein
MRLQITPADVKRSKLVAPGWYVTLVQNVAREPNKQGDSFNIIVDFEGQEGASEGAIARVYFSEKAPGIALPFVEALTGQKVNEETGIDFDFSSAKGRKLKALWDQDEWQGRKKNVVKDYGPLANFTTSAVSASGPGEDF